MSTNPSTTTPHLSDGSWLSTPMSETDARRLVIRELGGIWTETRVDGAAFAAEVMVHAWNHGDLTEREAESLLRYVGSKGPRPTWLPDLTAWKEEFLQ